MSSASQKFILPFADTISGTSISQKLRFLAQTQWWSREELESFQLQRLRVILQYAFSNIPYYVSFSEKTKLTAADFYSYDDLSKLPIITKETVRNLGYEQFVSKKIPSRHTLSYFSSGSSGQPFLYYLTKESYSIKYAAAIRGWQWMGYTMGDHYAKLSQNERKGWEKKLQDKINRSSYYFIPDLKPSSLEKIIIQLDKDKPLYIRCYPDPLYFMARIMQEKGIVFNWVKAINTTGNTLYGEARSLIEKQFNCTIYDGYSCEGAAMFYQADGYDGYLGSMETAISEVLDEQGNQVKPGETGRHITTELWNLAMPFIRYDTGDLLVLDDQSTHAGRNLFSVKKIIGRESDVLIAPDGNLLIVHLFTIYFEYFRSIRQFQVEQADAVTFIFRLVVDKGFTKAIENQIRSYWEKFLGSRAIVKIEIHDQIPLLFSGKRRFLIRNKEIKLF